jgi:cytochrome P450
VINEGIRMTPPLTAGFPKKVPVGGDTICGKVLPAGTDIHISFISLMRDQEVFGHDVEVFRPERFIDCDEITKARRLKVVDLNFGYGRWMCLGKVLAWMEMNKIFVEVSGNSPTIASRYDIVMIHMLKLGSAVEIVRFPSAQSRETLAPRIHHELLHQGFPRQTVE